MDRKQFGRACIRKVRSWVRRSDQWLTCQHDAFYPASELRTQVRRIGGGYHGSEAEWDGVRQYWKRFGIRPKRIWYALYCDGLGAYDPRFIPDPIWFRFIIPCFNNFRMTPAYADKTMYNRLITGVKHPETVAKRMAEHYYNGDGEQVISREEAELLCMQEDHLIIKPAGGSKGAGIVFYDKNDKACLPIRDIFDSMRGNFVAQRIVKQHADLARLNPGSLNTIRVLSFHYKDTVHVLSAQLRIGGINARVDNYSAGGNAVAVKPDGWLYEKAVNHDMEWIDTTFNGIKLKEVRVPNFQGIVDAIKKLHGQLPYFDIVGWDFAVGEDGTPIIIEFNTKPGQNQIGGKEPTFGEMTDEVLDEVFRKRHGRRH